MKEKADILQLFSNARHRKTYLRISAPMVRYSKLEFRSLLRHNNVDLCFTPMIIADSFCQSDLARQNEFSTNSEDSPLVVQFAAKDAIDMLTASELVFPYCDGVDLNCGCPQRWAVASGYGCATLKNPELLHDMMHAMRRNFPSQFTVSIKMRLLQKDSTRSTIELCRQLEMCGVSFVSIHGRTQWEKVSEPVDAIAISEIKKSLRIPVIANGDVRTLEDANRMHSITDCDGIMSARGLLTNPSLFTGTSISTQHCIQDWIGLAQAANDRISFQCFHHHLAFMMEKCMERKLRIAFNSFTQRDQVLEFLKRELDITTACYCRCTTKVQDNLKCVYDDLLYANRKANQCSQRVQEPAKTTVGNRKFFDEFSSRDGSADDCDDQLGFMGGSIFDT